MKREGGDGGRSRADSKEKGMKDRGGEKSQTAKRNRGRG